MIQNFKTIKFNNCEEIVEKKSRFIASLIYVENEEEALSKIKEVKKKYYDARHNCFAYRVLDGESIIQRSSDDGEPSGTAGAPMLNILEKNNIVNVLVVVTRYFGGILLGTGGLVKAYSEATLKSLENNEIVEKEMGYEVKISLPYTAVQKIEYFLKTNNISIINKEFLDNVIIFAELSQKKYQKIIQEFPENVIKNLKIKIEKEKIISKNVSEWALLEK